MRAEARARKQARPGGRGIPTTGRKADAARRRKRAATRARSSRAPRRWRSRGSSALARRGKRDVTHHRPAPACDPEPILRSPIPSPCPRASGRTRGQIRGNPDFTGHWVLRRVLAWLKAPGAPGRDGVARKAAGGTRLRSQRHKRGARRFIPSALPFRVRTEKEGYDGPQRQSHESVPVGA